MSKARQLADLGNVYDDGALSNRNMVINGDMAISQRIAADTDASTNNTYNCVDRFYCTAGWTGVNQRRDTTDAPVGFSNCLHVSSATGVGSLSSTGNWSTIQQLIEGYNIAHLNWGTANAQTVTLSFWVKASQDGTWSVAINNGNSNSLSDNMATHSYVATYNVDAVGTWEYKTITIDGPTVGSWDKTNGAGVTIYFNLGSGSNYTGTTANEWVSGKYVQTSSANNLYTGDNQYFKLTGVQLEVGDTATPFEHPRSYSDELARCQRYFWSRIQTHTIYAGDYGSNSFATFDFPVTMRATPTVTATLNKTLLTDYSSQNSIQLYMSGTAGAITAANPLYADAEL